jgi:hypothetical protein
MKKLLLFAMALILAACSAMGTGGTDLSRNQSKWDKAGIKNYRYSLHIGCFCAFRDRMPLTVEVRDGKMVSMSYSDGTPVSAEDMQIDFFQQFSTIDGIFADLSTGGASKAEKVEVTYDPTYGFPAQVYVDQILQAADDEYSVQVSNFEVLK